MYQNKIKPLIYLVILMYIPILLIFIGKINIVPIISLLLSIILITLIFFTKFIKVGKRTKLYLSIVAIVIATISLIFSTFFTIMTSSGNSMTPALKEDSYRFVWQRDFNIKNGDIVVAHAPTWENENQKQTVYKRVVAQKGDKIFFYIYGDTAKATINDEFDVTIFTHAMEKMIKHIDLNNIIKDDVILLLGDNKETSYDGRYYGFIPRKDILGKVLFEF